MPGVVEALLAVESPACCASARLRPEKDGPEEVMRITAFVVIREDSSFSLFWFREVLVLSLYQRAAQKNHPDEVGAASHH